VRNSGVLQSVRGLGLHDHACLPFDDDEVLRGAVVDWLTEGRRLGQRLLYVGRSAEEELRGDLAGLAGRDRLLADGALELFSLPALYTLGEPIDSEAQLAVYAGATERSLKDGFTGLRVAAEVTALVEAPQTWEAHIRWEAHADRFMAEMPLAALCCYDLRKLPRSTVADLACVHPAAVACEEFAPFQLFAGADRKSLMLRGEVDFFCAEDLDRLLDLAMPPEGRVPLDLSRLDFVDQHGVMRLAARAREPGGRVRVTNVPPQARKVSELLGAAL
jgi:anti-anti-sigma regulatory factor